MDTRAVGWQVRLEAGMKAAMLNYCVRNYLETLEFLKGQEHVRDREDLPVIAAVCVVLAETEDTLEKSLLEHVHGN